MLLAAQTDLKFTSVSITDNVYRHRESRQEHGSLVVEFTPISFSTGKHLLTEQTAERRKKQLLVFVERQELRTIG